MNKIINDEKEIKINDVLKQTKTGDLLLFHTRKHWYDYIIEFFSESKFTHIGIIVNKNDISMNDINMDISMNNKNNKNEKELLFLESGKESFPDIKNNNTFGVQIVSLEKVLQEYANGKNGFVYYRELDCIRDISFSNTFSTIIKDIYNKPYDLDVFDWVKSFFHLNNIGNTEKTNTFWCSALVAYVYDKLNFITSLEEGIISPEKEIPWTIIQPKQFSYYETLSKSYKYKLKFSPNITLHPERKIVYS